MTVQCAKSAPGTEFRVLASCPDGLRYSRWAVQGDGVTMQCDNIRLADIQYR